MRFGRTAFVNFVSQITVSIAGFVGTIVLTRTLGQSRYGTYVLVISVLSWMVIVGDLGLISAVKKRVSEQSERNYISAGIISQFLLFVVASIAIVLASPYLSSFLGINATAALIGLLGSQLLVRFVRAVLQGQHLVHVSSLVDPVLWATRSVTQVIFVLAGLGLTGAFLGYLFGGIVASMVGWYFVKTQLSIPSRAEFRDIRSYAQFSWLGSVKGRTFLSMDTLILGFFVAHGVIAVYEVAWNLATLFAVFSSSITLTLFPEMSRISSASGTDEISGLLSVSLAWSGLFIIPGLVGSATIGDLILTVYGPGFDTGYYILLVLVVARLLYGYHGQFTSTINAVDRPDLTFRVDAAFVVSNLLLNAALIPEFGWYGAAAATLSSSALGLGLGYWYASQVITVRVPFGEIGRQILAAGVMGVVVYISRAMLGDTLPVAVLLAFVGGGVYFLLLIILSREFRTTVEDNLPFELPVFDTS